MGGGKPLVSKIIMHRISCAGGITNTGDKGIKVIVYCYWPFSRPLVRKRQYVTIEIDNMLLQKFW